MSKPIPESNPPPEDRRISLGVLATLLLIVLGATGLTLAPWFRWDPAVAPLDAADLRDGVGVPGAVRSLHRWTAEAVVVVALLHLLRSFLGGGARRSRANWILGVGLLVLLLGAHGTGALLPSDATATGVRVALLGAPLAAGSATAGVVWVFHCLLLPGALTLAVVGHWRRARRDDEEDVRP